jgi:uncharacterized protein
MKGVIHMDQGDVEILSTALGNINNFLKEVGESSDLCMVVNHHAVRFFQKSNAADHAGTIAALASQGIRFLICRNSIGNLNIDPSELLDACEVIPSGIVEVIRLQNNGFAYVKP